MDSSGMLPSARALLLSIALLLGVSACDRAEKQAAAARANGPPNVLFIISDDQGWGDYGFMGHDSIQTPNLDRLASESLVYTRGYVPTSTCRPSLASIITGLYPHQHGITSNATAGEENSSANQRVWVEGLRTKPRLPALLGDAGWVSMQTGKWWEGSYENGGFTIGLTKGKVDAGFRFGGDGLDIGREPMRPFLQHLDAWRARQYFLWYAPMLPHKPHDAPERLVSKYRREGVSDQIARYEATVEWFDETVGKLLHYLDESGLAENTLVVYLADNGWIQLPDAKRWGDWGPAKLSAYDAGVRTPIMLRWPGKIEPRRDDEHLASSIDLLPTVLSALGLDVPDAQPGIDLLDARAVAERDAVFGSIHSRKAVDLRNPVTSLKWRWVVQGRHKLIAPYAPNRDVVLKSYDLGGNTGAVANDDIPWHGRGVELYDLIADPTERSNLAAAQPDRVAELQARLDEWWPVPEASSL